MSAMSPAIRPWQGSAALRSMLLFVNFFLILVAYYLVKPASRSLFLEHSEAAMLPYVWTASGLLLLALVPGYQALLQRFGRLRVVLGCCLGTALALLGFRGLFESAGAPTAIAFYILVDIFSVVLVEQFWSLTNSVYDSKEGKRWYGLIASGGLVGGLVGGLAASNLVQHGGLATADLISLAAALLLVMLLLTQALARAGVYREQPAHAAARRADTGPVDLAMVWESLRSNRLVMIITLLVLFSQIIEPVVEYQFMHHVEQTYADRDARTVFLSDFLSLLSGLALAVNILITPLVHRYAGVVGGLMAQPLLLGVSAFAYLLQPQLGMAMAMKLTDRALSYSINRASKELLYVGTEAARIFRIKAWIDMVGYRSFKIAGNLAIIAVGQLAWQTTHYVLAGITLAVCAAWVLAVWALRRPRPESDPEPRKLAGGGVALVGTRTAAVYLTAKAASPRPLFARRWQTPRRRVRLSRI